MRISHELRNPIAPCNMTYPTKARSFSLLLAMSRRSSCSTRRTVGIGYWNASSQDFKFWGSGPSDAMVEMVSGTQVCSGQLGGRRGQQFGGNGDRRCLRRETQCLRQHVGFRRDHSRLGKLLIDRVIPADIFLFCPSVFRL